MCVNVSILGLGVGDTEASPALTPPGGWAFAGQLLLSSVSPFLSQGKENESHNRHSHLFPLPTPNSPSPQGGNDPSLVGGRRNEFVQARMIWLSKGSPDQIPNFPIPPTQTQAIEAWGGFFPLTPERQFACM